MNYTETGAVNANHFSKFSAFGLIFKQTFVIIELQD